MMDVDDPLGEGFDHLIREDLHVPRHHDEIDSVFAKELNLELFLRGLRIFRDGVDAIVDAELFGDRLEIGMVADDEGNVAMKLA